MVLVYDHNWDSLIDIQFVKKFHKVLCFIELKCENKKQYTFFKQNPKSHKLQAGISLTQLYLSVNGLPVSDKITDHSGIEPLTISYGKVVTSIWV